MSEAQTTREQIIQAGRNTFCSTMANPSVNSEEAAYLAAAAEVLRVVQERLNARLMMTGAHPLADAFVEVRSLLSEIESETQLENKDQGGHEPPFR